MFSWKGDLPSKSCSKPPTEKRVVIASELLASKSSPQMSALDGAAFPPDSWVFPEPVCAPCPGAGLGLDGCQLLSWPSTCFQSSCSPPSFHSRGTRGSAGRWPTQGHTDCSRQCSGRLCSITRTVPTVASGKALHQAHKVSRKQGGEDWGDNVYPAQEHLEVRHWGPVRMRPELREGSVSTAPPFGADYTIPSKSQTRLKQISTQTILPVPTRDTH